MSASVGGWVGAWVRGCVHECVGEGDVLVQLGVAHAALLLAVDSQDGVVQLEPLRLLRRRLQQRPRTKMTLDGGWGKGDKRAGVWRGDNELAREHLCLSRMPHATASPNRLAGVVGTSYRPSHGHRLALAFRCLHASASLLSSMLFSRLSPMLSLTLSLSLSSLSLSPLSLSLSLSLSEGPDLSGPILSYLLS